MIKKIILSTALISATGLVSAAESPRCADARFAQANQAACAETIETMRSQLRTSGGRTAAPTAAPTRGADPRSAGRTQQTAPAFGDSQASTPAPAFGDSRASRPAPVDADSRSGGRPAGARPSGPAPTPAARGGRPAEDSGFAPAPR